MFDSMTAIALCGKYLGAPIKEVEGLWCFGIEGVFDDICAVYIDNTQDFVHVTIRFHFLHEESIARVRRTHSSVWLEQQKIAPSLRKKLHRLAGELIQHDIRVSTPSYTPDEILIKLQS